MVEKMFDRKNLSSKEVYEVLTVYLDKHCSEYREEKANYDECVVALSFNFAEGQQLIEAHIKRIVFSAGFAYELDGTQVPVLPGHALTRFGSHAVRPNLCVIAGSCRKMLT